MTVILTNTETAGYSSADEWGEKKKEKKVGMQEKQAKNASHHNSTDHAVNVWDDAWIVRVRIQTTFDDERMNE